VSRFPKPLRWPIAITVISAALIVAALVYFAPSVEVTTAVIGGSVTVLGGALLLAVGRHYDTTRELEAHSRQRKSDEYEKFIDFWFSVLFASKLGKRPPSPTELQREMNSFTRTLTIWGSDDLIRTWGAFRKKGQQMKEGEARTREENLRMLKDFEDLLIAVRRGAGSPDTGLRAGDLLALFLIDETPSGAQSDG